MKGTDSSACGLRMTVKGTFSFAGAVTRAPETFPLEGGRWMAEGQTDEGAFHKWFGAPHR